MARISVVGTSGSGKTTTGRRIAAVLGAPFIELDSIRHQADWQELPDDEFRSRVSELTSTAAWIVDGNYIDVLSGLVQRRATDVVWVDPPRRAVMIQVLWRSFSRALTRRELWNGNREEFRNWLDPEHPIRWAWSTFESRRAEFGAAAAASEVPWTRLRNRGETAAFIARLDRAEP